MLAKRFSVLGEASLYSEITELYKMNGGRRPTRDELYVPIPLLLLLLFKMNGGRRPNQGRGTANKHEQGQGRGKQSYVVVAVGR